MEKNEWTSDNCLCVLVADCAWTHGWAVMSLSEHPLWLGLERSMVAEKSI
jgi:hypothetical protein